MNKKNNNKDAFNEENIVNKNVNGADPEEQAMNGSYGMLETAYEDSLHDKDEEK